MEILVRGLEPGQNYVLQARSKYPNGVTSGWSTTYKLLTQSDVTAPSPVTGLTWTTNGTSFVATWVRPTTDSNGKDLKDFNGYEVTVTAASVSKKYVVLQERFDFSFEQNVGAFGSPQPTVQISVKVFDMVGNLSSAVTASATNPIPANITNFVAQGIMNSISLTWDATVENDFKQYEVYHSISASSFTPDSTNLLAVTATPSFVFTTTNSTTHYFKIRQVDVFNQGSAGYASASATPILSTGLDTTPPNAPTSVAVSTAATANGSSNITVTWTASASTNLAQYVVRYSTDQVNWRYVAVPASQTTATIDNLLPGTAYYVAVASVSQVSSYSAFVNAATYPVTTAADTTPPSQPAAPTVSISSGTANAAQVNHDLTKNAGGALESDVVMLEVHASTTTGFTTNGTTLRGTIQVTSSSVPVSGVFYYPVTTSITNLYWKVIAVDRAGNKSAASNQATGVPGLILTANIADAQITNAKINDLAANKITAGTGIINSLSVKSSLTLDDPNSFVKSGNYDGTAQTGWRLDQSGLVIYNGTISASALQLQNSANIMPAPFADFEFNSTYYHDASNIPNSTVLSCDSGLLLQSVTSSKKTGVQALRVFNTSITNPTLHNLYFATGTNTATGVNIDVDPGDYIYSVYVKKNGSVNGNLQLAIVTDAGTTITDATINSITNTTFTRYSAVFTVPSGVSKIKTVIVIGPQASNTGYDIVIDSVQFERRISGSASPSSWRAPSSTIIDGGSIITGSIRSSASAAGVTGQPAWSLNTAGNIQVGDALVRGSLTVGAGADTTNSIVQSVNYVANGSGWAIRGDGTAEFNSTTIRGNLTVTGTNGKISTALLGNYPTIFLYNANSSNWGYINLVDGTGSNANVGINSGEYTSTQDNVTKLRARLWMVLPNQGSRLGHVRSDTQQPVGGQYTYNETDAYLSAFSLDSLEKSRAKFSNGAYIELATKDPMSNALNTMLRVDSVNSRINTYSQTTATAANTQLILQGSNGTIYLQGGSETALDGKALVLGATTSQPGGYLRVSNEGWNTPAFQNTYGGSVQYKLFPDGTISFRGSITGGTRASPSTIFNLPAGYRALQYTEFVCSVNSGTTHKIIANTNGDIAFYAIGAAGAAIYVDNVRYTTINY